MKAHTVHTEIEISAPAGRIWKILTDIRRYHSWNPMIRNARGKLKVGAWLRLYFHPRGTIGVIFHPYLVTVDEPREFRWRGLLAVPKVFVAEHVFYVTAVNDKQTLLVQDMEFYGLFAPLAVKLKGRMMREAFDGMNRALKQQAETRQA